MRFTRSQAINYTFLWFTDAERTAFFNIILSVIITFQPVLKAPEFQRIFSCDHMWISCCHEERDDPADFSENRQLLILIEKTVRNISHRFGVERLSLLAKYWYLKCICVANDVITSVERDWVTTTGFVFNRTSLLLATQFKVIVNWQ